MVKYQILSPNRVTTKRYGMSRKVGAQRAAHGRNKDLTSSLKVSIKVGIPEVMLCRIRMFVQATVFV